MSDLAGALVRRLESRQATVGVIGLGYVGLPVAVAFANEGFSVIGVDANPEKVAALRSGSSYIGDVDGDRIRPLVESGRLRVETSAEALREADAILICVPTPLTHGQPDLSMVTGAGHALFDVLKKGALVVLESTTYPGTTEELLCPLLEGDVRRAGEDFLLAFSPERIDPGNELFAFEDIPKVVGGIDEASTRAAEALYKQVVPKVFTVSSPREAELTKLIENTFRHVNIGLVNELALYAHEMGVDIWESLEAAATKPFGYLPFWPGPGWGGHCIPLDPAYLSYRVRQDRAHDVRFVELAHTINSEMPRFVAQRAAELLNEHGKAVRGSRILGVGVAFKGGVEDTRGSAGLKVLSMLAHNGADISFHDPLVSAIEIEGRNQSSVALDAKVCREADLILVFINQENVDWSLIRTEAKAVLDCCNALGGRAPNVERL